MYLGRLYIAFNNLNKILGDFSTNGVSRIQFT